MLRQLSVFVENRRGSMTDVTSVLTAEGINLRAFCIADTADFGIIRMIVDEPEAAAEKLRAAGLVVNVTKVFGVLLPDEPGALNKVLCLLSEAGVDVEYSYAFASPKPGTAYLIMRIRDEAKGKELLKDYYDI